MLGKKVFNCLKSIVLASFAVLGVFLILSIVINAALREFTNRIIRELALGSLIMVLYAVFLYRIHMYNRLDTYAEHTDVFDIKKELISYVHSEGKVMFILYGIAAAVTELSFWILPEGTKNPINFSTMFCFGLWMGIPVPVLRSIVAFAYASAVVCLLAVLRSWKIHRERLFIKEEKKNRRE